MKKKRASKPRSGSYIAIQEWMVKSLGLQGDELLIYAIIYGFSQDGSSCFTGTTNYLCFWTGKTKETVLKYLASLRNKNLIGRMKKPTSNKQKERYFCDYWATITHCSTEEQDKVFHNWSNFSTSIIPREDE